MYQTNGPLVGYISFKNFKRIRYERQGEEQKGPKKVSKKIKTLAFHHLQTGNKILFKRRRFVEQTILYKIRRFQASYDVFLAELHQFYGKHQRIFSIFSPYPSSGKCRKKKFESNRSVYTFGILRAPILHANGYFISSYSRTAMGGKGLINNKLMFN